MEQIKTVDKKNWIDTENLNIFKMLLVPFKIYFRRFFSYFFLSVIPEFLIFGIFYIVIIDIGYNFTAGVFTVNLDFISDEAEPYLIILLIIAVILIMLRSVMVTALSWKIIQKGKGNPFWAIEVTFKQIKQVVASALIVIAFLFVPIMIFLLAILMEIRMPGVSWLMIAFAVGVPLIIGSRISLFSTGITKDHLPVGTAFQNSWHYTRGANWLKTALLLTIFASISFILPVFLTNYFNDVIGPWMGYVMIAIRALLYPLFDISNSLNYIQSEEEAINKAHFSDDIKKHKQLSEKLSVD